MTLTVIMHPEDIAPHFVQYPDRVELHRPARLGEADRTFLLHILRENFYGVAGMMEQYSALQLEQCG